MEKKGDTFAQFDMFLGGQGNEQNLFTDKEVDFIGRKAKV